MAHYEGSVKDFTKYIGAYARNKVLYISLKYKRQIGACEECGETKNLEAAHVKGQERAHIISTIISQYIERNTLKIDLQEFEERFVAAHTPIEKSIRILCKPCHRAYDNTQKMYDLPFEEKEPDILANEEGYEEKEGQLIEKLVEETMMNKSKAIDIGHNNQISSLTISNTIFSNINAAQDVWWLEPNNKKFERDLFIILNNDREKVLYFFRLPAKTIAAPEDYFKQRNDKHRKNCSDIYIPVSGKKFQDKKGFDFSEYLINKLGINY